MTESLEDGKVSTDILAVFALFESRRTGLQSKIGFGDISKEGVSLNSVALKTVTLLNPFESFRHILFQISPGSAVSGAASVAAESEVTLSGSAIGSPVDVVVAVDVVAESRHGHSGTVVVGSGILENIVVDLSLPALFTSHMDGVDTVAVEGAVADGHVVGGIKPDTVESGVKNTVFNQHAVRTVSEELDVAHASALVRTVEEAVADGKVLGPDNVESPGGGGVRQTDEVESFHSHVAGAVDLDGVVEQVGHVQESFSGNFALDGDTGKVHINFLGVDTGKSGKASVWLFL